MEYFILCRATNGDGIVSSEGVSDGITVDTTAPSRPVVTDDGDETYNLTLLHATFTAAEDFSLVTGYRYCIGTYQGGQDVKGWTETAAGETTASGLSLTPGVTYYFSVRAKNSLGMWSLIGYSDGITAWSGAPPPVPDGSFGSGATFKKLSSDGSQIKVGWDTSTCAAPGYSIFYGDLSQVSNMNISGSECSIGNDGSYDWNSDVPSGDVFFIIVSNNGLGTEGSWGTDYQGGSHNERGGTTASGQCGLTARDNSGTCP